MTAVEIGLTVAVAVVGLLALAAAIDAIRNRQLIAEMAVLGTELAEYVDALERRKPGDVSPLDPQILELSDCISDHARAIERLNGQFGTLKGIEGVAHKARQIARQADERTKALESRVDGMLVAREVLKPCACNLIEPTFRVEAAHASADFDLTAPTEERFESLRAEEQTAKRELDWSVEYGDKDEEIHIAASSLADDGDAFQWRIVPVQLGYRPLWSLAKSESELDPPKCEYESVERAKLAAQMLDEAIQSRYARDDDDQPTERLSIDEPPVRASLECEPIPPEIQERVEEILTARGFGK